ncbi:MAG: ABC transporter ATP-binding protein [Gammaproteobacteria bacterium]|nr:ABC transporter ATP-binding protein [Gammaproteobacteria bacterium]
MARVTLQQLNKVYGGTVHAVSDLDLQIEDGEFMALLGPSGCGKTSTLRIIVGLETPTSGDILFDHARVNAMTPQQRNVAMAFESYALYPNMSVLENLTFPLEIKRVDAAERNRKARHIAAILGIADVLDARPGALSGGQQQRVSLGRALIRDPAVFALDEVMSHVDSQLKFRMLSELSRLHRDIGGTMIYVTHDQMEALALADRIAVMRDSRLCQVGTRNDLYHRPADTFVADFIGEPPINLLPATVRGGDGPVTLTAQGGLEIFPDAAAARALAAANIDACLVGIRPQNLRPMTAAAAASAETTSTQQALSGVVELAEYLGETMALTVRCAETVWRALAPAGFGARAGDAVRLHYAAADVLLFNAESGKRIASADS